MTKPRVLRLGWRRIIVLILVAGLTLPLLARFALPYLLPTFELGASSQQGALTVTAIAAEAPADWPDGLELRGAWQLDSKEWPFGGFSALVPLPGGKFRAYSDRGFEMDFSDPDEPSPDAYRTSFVPRDTEFSKRWEQDIEGAALDPASGDIWLTYEHFHAVRRFPADGSDPVRYAPPAMQGWPDNSGAEAFTRLPDGRFVLLEEETNGEGLLFPGDPTAGVAPEVLRFAAPAGMQPSDMALLPDGRVLILLRGLRIGWPPFKAALAVADPATIRAGEAWRFELLARIEKPLPIDNFEGVAVTEGQAGEILIWLISDNNIRRTLQHTVLLKLAWKPTVPAQQKAREDDPARPD